MRKSVIAFDLDGTLAESKSALEDRMSDLLGKLLEKYQVCVMSGGKFGQFEKQLLSNLQVDPVKLEFLHLMPTCGTKYFSYDIAKHSWNQVYAEDLTKDEKRQIQEALEKSIDELGYRESKPWGDLIEDRGSQITFSALGQEAPVKEKETWDPSNDKKRKLRDLVAQYIPQFEVRAGGTTSIDVTKLGIDKAYGMHKLLHMLEVSKDEVLFMGDALYEGGNDYPVKTMGVECISVRNWQDTAYAIEGIVGVS